MVAVIQQVLLDRKGQLLAPLLPKRRKVCAWCRRFEHRDGTPHGRPLVAFPEDYSSGICSACLPLVYAGALGVRLEVTARG